VSEEGAAKGGGDDDKVNQISDMEMRCRTAASKLFKLKLMSNISANNLAIMTSLVTSLIPFEAIPKLQEKVYSLPNNSLNDNNKSDEYFHCASYCFFS
jgi:hypothetical protein